MRDRFDESPAEVISSGFRISGEFRVGKTGLQLLEVWMESPNVPPTRNYLLWELPPASAPPVEFR